MRPLAWRPIGEGAPTGGGRIRRYLIPIEIGGREERTPIFVGEPGRDEHPLTHQDRWLRRERGAAIAESVMEPFGKLHRIAVENGKPYLDIVQYALGETEAPGPSEPDDAGSEPTDPGSDG